MTLDITLNVQKKIAMKTMFGETGRRMSERVIDHNGRDKNSHIFKHSVEREHRPPSLQEFSILGGN